MATKTYTVIPRCPIKGIKDHVITKQCDLQLNDAEAIRILRAGSQLKLSGVRVKLEDLVDPKSEQVHNDTTVLAPDATNGCKTEIRSECKIVGSPAHYVPKTQEVAASVVEVPDPVPPVGGDEHVDPEA